MMIKNILAVSVIAGAALVVPFFLQNQPNIQTQSQKTSTFVDLESFDFEVFGKVQGVYFRKFTKSEADSLGVRGWVMNTQDGTVVGTAEGHSKKLKQMEDWLRAKGSPKSTISKFQKNNHKKIESFTFKGFEIRR